MNTTTATTEVTRPIATTRVAAQVQRCGGVTCPPGTCDHDDEIRRSADGPGPAAVPATVLGVLDTPGTPLDAGTRTSMEGRFGHDFGRVRIHTDADAARSAADIHALAYTYGPHVVMGAGRYQPHTSAGQRLLAHELTHVVQQGAPTGLPTSISNPHAAAERQADTVANEKTTAPAPSAASGLVARQVAGQVEATIARQAESVEAPAVATPSPPDAATDVEPTRATSPVRTPPQCPPYGAAELAASQASGGRTKPAGPGDESPLVYDFVHGNSQLRPVHEPFLRSLIAGNRLDTPSPTATVTVILGFADCVADQPVDTGLRVRRADAARRFLLDSGALPANIGPATVDLSADAPGDNSPGLGRDLLRSARVVLDVRKPPDPPSNGRTTHRYHLVMKSFIRTIGWDAGSLLCPLHPANQIGDVIGVSANLRLRALAAVTDLGFGETAPTDTRDNLYRLYSARDFTVICEDGSPVAISGSEIDTDNGHEGPLSTPALTVFDRSQTGGGSSPLRFAWSAKGRPALAAEPAFQGVCWRTSRYIWHHVEGAVDCAGLRVTSVLGSHFPTHRVYLDGTVVSTIPQGPFVNLWHPAADPEMVE